MRSKSKDACPFDRAVPCRWSRCFDRTSLSPMRSNTFTSVCSIRPRPKMRSIVSRFDRRPSNPRARRHDAPPYWINRRFSIPRRRWCVHPSFKTKASSRRISFPWRSSWRYSTAISFSFVDCLEYRDPCSYSFLLVFEWRKRWNLSCLGIFNKNDPYFFSFSHSICHIFSKGREGKVSWPIPLWGVASCRS